MNKNKTVGIIGLALAALFATSPASASQTFDYSYTFDTGQVVSGSFTGTAAGDLISDLSNISASIDGVALPQSGNLFSESWVGFNSGHGAPGAVVSFDGLQSNFIFGDNALDSYFYVVPWYNGNQTIGTQALSLSTGYIDYYNGNYNASNWNVVAAPVPEPTEGALLLSGIGLLGFIATRRKKSA